MVLPETENRLDPVELTAPNMAMKLPAEMDAVLPMKFMLTSLDVEPKLIPPEDPPVTDSADDPVIEMIGVVLAAENTNPPLAPINVVELAVMVTVVDAPPMEMQ
jgi:hypothetical protein